MASQTLEQLGNQVSGMARNLASGATSAVRSETSIVGRANALLTRAMDSSRREKRQKPPKPKKQSSGVYILTEEEARARDLTGGELFTAPDGYVRKTPVQGIRRDPEYGRKLAAKIVKTVLLLAVLALVVYALYRYRVISF